MNCHKNAEKGTSLSEAQTETPVREVAPSELSVGPLLRPRPNPTPYNEDAVMRQTTGWAKKVSLVIFAITVSTASQFSYFWRVYAVRNLQPEDL